MNATTIHVSAWRSPGTMPLSIASAASGGGASAAARSNAASASSCASTPTLRAYARSKSLPVSCESTARRAPRFSLRRAGSATPTLAASCCRSVSAATRSRSVTSAKRRTAAEPPRVMAIRLASISNSPDCAASFRKSRCTGGSAMPDGRSREAQPKRTVSPVIGR